MHKDIVVFLGPTMSMTEARSHLDAIYLPPAGRADVMRAVIERSPRAILIIDGVFAEAPGVRHQEILWALSRGVEVHGAASIGALRAAELSNEGMQGHGTIYRWYRRFPLADDGEVAVAMAPAELGSVRLGDALVDIRVHLKSAERAGIIDREIRRQLEAVAGRLHFRDRSLASVLATAQAQSAASDQLRGLGAWLKTNKVSQKRSDAVAALRYLSQDRSTELDASAQKDFELTEAFAFDMDACNLLESLLPAFGNS